MAMQWLGWAPEKRNWGRTIGQGISQAGQGLATGIMGKAKLQEEQRQFDEQQDTQEKRLALEKTRNFEESMNKIFEQASELGEGAIDVIANIFVEEGKEFNVNEKTIRRRAAFWKMREKREAGGRQREADIKVDVAGRSRAAVLAAEEEAERRRFEPGARLTPEPGRFAPSFAELKQQMELETFEKKEKIRVEAKPVPRFPPDVQKRRDTVYATASRTLLNPGAEMEIPKEDGTIMRIPISPGMEPSLRQWALKVINAYQRNAPLPPMPEGALKSALASALGEGKDYKTMRAEELMRLDASGDKDAGAEIDRRLTEAEK